MIFVENMQYNYYKNRKIQHNAQHVKSGFVNSADLCVFCGLSAYGVHRIWDVPDLLAFYITDPTKPQGKKILYKDVPFSECVPQMFRKVNTRVKSKKPENP